ncbi:GGDEF domain-containing protein [Pseudobutyrivibrio sp. MD2005]|uniref:GGDEF domain-containing protein n=1 Tax=Pseudobutyrivibrio sp. MD2005 TaxID=1410616 RepID=UPI000480FE00|nr:GGDEF domain-containing protein [Pseudobutyrivibrio sp. MD2005]
MLKNNLKKLLLVYIIIIAGILICQLCYRAYTNFQINANHKKVEEILEHRLKFSWEEREAMLKDINALINSGKVSPEDMGRLYEKAGIIYMSSGETTTYYKYLGYALYYLKNSSETDFTINVYLDLANFYINNYDYDSASSMIEAARELRPFEEIENPQIRSYAYRIQGINSFLKYNYNDAETYLNESIRVLDEDGTESYKEEYTAMSDVWLARIYEETGRLPKCKEKLDKWEDNYMFTTDIYRNIYLRDFIIPYYQAKCYYLCAENIKERNAPSSMDTEARAQAVIVFLRDFMKLCEENNYEKAELYTLLKIQKEYPTKNQEIQSELTYVCNRLYDTLFKQQNLTYSNVVGSIIDDANNELAINNTNHLKQIQKIKIRITIGAIFSFIIAFLILLLNASRFDGLTKLLNRKSFDFELSRMKHSKQEYGIIMIDIDNFKTINDTYGHPEGDIVLWRLGQLITKETTSDIKAYRYGGEEFVIMINSNAIAYLNAIAERLRNSMAQQEWDFAPDVKLTLSIGTAKGRGNDDVVKAADNNLYKAKANGKNQVVTDAR